jgi:hypothetical protein
MTTESGCQAWREDDDGNIETEGVCERVGTWISCVPFVGARTCDEHKCRCAKPIKPPLPPGSVSEDSGRPWKSHEMTVHRQIARDYPVEASLRGLPGDHVRRWVATVDTLQARIDELEDSIRLDEAEADIAQSYGRNTSAVRVAAQIQARRGKDWSGAVVCAKECDAEG